VVIVGDRDHPEVIGLMGHGNGRVRVIDDPADVPDLPEGERLCVVAQTTQDGTVFEGIVRAVRERFPDALIFDTICDATHSRQEEVRRLATQVDGLVVVGGYHSANTQRLVQVSEASGLPTFHVETEKDLDKDRLSAMEVVGVTAGASTPNWMIKNVVQEIESIRSRKETFIGRALRRSFRFLFLSNVGVATGAFSLSYGAGLLMGRPRDLIHPALAFLYIYAMYILNRFVDKGASTYNDPGVARFYRKNRLWLIVTGVAASLGALALALRLGRGVFLAITGLSILGVIYSIPIIPSSRRDRWRYVKIKDIPGSRTLSEALAWGVVIALLPLLEARAPAWSGAMVTFLVVITMVYVRAALFDVLQAQGDLIVGVETLPITLGEQRTLLLLKGVILFGALVLALGPLISTVGPFAYVLILCFLSLSLTLLAYEKRWVYPGPRLEALVESNLLLAGFLGMVWHQAAWPV
jgi:4-hydroxy-3-methylbut-2-enyl diphosphate reductase